MPDDDVIGLDHEVLGLISIEASFEHAPRAITVDRCLRADPTTFASDLLEDSKPFVEVARDGASHDDVIRRTLISPAGVAHTRYRSCNDWRERALSPAFVR